MFLMRIAVGLLGLAGLAAAGDLNGQILITRQLTKKTVNAALYNLRGTPPPAAATGSEPINEFERTVVYVQGGKANPLPPKSVVMEQRNSRFEPELLILPVGSTVQFPNADPIFHNVFSLSKAHPFDLGYYSKSQSRSVTFNQAGVVQLYCHIHASMYGAIVVTDSPWNEKLSGDGSFVFHNLPAGHYRVVAWHKVAGSHWVDVDVPESGMAHVTIGVPISEEHR